MVFHRPDCKIVAHFIQCKRGPAYPKASWAQLHLGYFCPTPQKGKNRRTRGVFSGCEWLNFNGELSLNQKISRDVQKSAARPNPTAE
jgi:hypothetical protein